MNYEEEAANAAHMPVALLAKSQKVTLLQMDSKLSMDSFQTVLQAAMVGCQQIYENLRNAVHEHTAQLLAAKERAAPAR